MKVLTTIICNCEDCTHFNFNDRWGCCHGKENRPIDPEDAIPIWCPLPDLEIIDETK